MTEVPDIYKPRRRQNRFEETFSEPVRMDGGHDGYAIDANLADDEGDAAVLFQECLDLADPVDPDLIEWDQVRFRFGPSHAGDTNLMWWMGATGKGAKPIWYVAAGNLPYERRAI